MFHKAGGGHVKSFGRTFELRKTTPEELYVILLRALIDHRAMVIHAAVNKLKEFVCLK